MSNTTLGVPRMKEILSVSKNLKTPQVVIYLTEEYKNNKEIAHKIASHIQYTTIGDIRKKVDIYFDSEPNAENSISKRDNIRDVFYKSEGKDHGKTAVHELHNLPWLVRVEIDREKMLDKKVTLLEIKSKLASWWDKRFLDVKNIKKEEKKVMGKISALSILSNTDNDAQPVIHIRFNVKDIDKTKDIFNIDTLNDFVDLVIDKFKLKGISEIMGTEVINERMISFNTEDGLMEKKTQNVIYTSGVNLIDIRYISGVDIYNTISNDIATIYTIFGIEIARTMLLREIINAFEKASVLYNYQHISVLVDLMTASGYIMSIDRHGVNKSDTDPLSRASFEKTVEHLLNAAAYSETDHMKGVSSRIMVGLAIKGGTGYCDVSLDVDAIQNSEYLDEYEQKYKFEIEGTPLINDIIKQDREDDFIPFE
jgi:DNA-directed RNA polymerase II subunit RPB1